ncbi:MFS transporter [Pseudomonas sp. MSSRFD41]|nr:MFS transporter [Pseudomonas sp. MSSRFD41]
MSHAKPRHLRRSQWTAVVLLMLMGIVNYFDRSTVAIANHLLSADLSLSATQMGWIFSAFSWAYAFAQLPSGALVDRKGARLVLGWALAAWSAAQAVCGLATSMSQLLVARVCLGVGESPQYTGGVKVVSDWFPVSERGLPTGAFLASTTLGSMIAPPLLTSLMVTFGWRGMFVIMGVVGGLLAVVWLVVYRDRNEGRLGPEDQAYFQDDTEVAVPKASFADWKGLFLHRTTWGIALGFVGVMYMVLLTLAWLPGYLAGERQLGVEGTGWVLTIPYLFATLGMFSSGWVADRLIAAGTSPIASRKLPLIAGLLGGALFCVPSVFVDSIVACIAYLSLAMFFVNLAGGSAWGLVSVAAPPQLVASLGSIQNFIGFFGGSFAPVVSGWIIDRTHSIALAFVLAAGVACLSALAYFLLVDRPIAATGDQGPTQRNEPDVIIKTGA